MDIEKIDGYLEQIRSATTNPTVLRVVGEIELLLVAEGKSEEAARKEEARKNPLPKKIEVGSHFSSSGYRALARTVQGRFERVINSGYSHSKAEVVNSINRIADFLEEIEGDDAYATEANLRRIVANQRHELRMGIAEIAAMRKWLQSLREDRQKLLTTQNSLQEQIRDLKVSNSHIEL